MAYRWCCSNCGNLIKENFNIWNRCPHCGSLNVRKKRIDSFVEP